MHPTLRLEKKGLGQMAQLVICLPNKPDNLS